MDALPGSESSRLKIPLREAAAATIDRVVFYALLAVIALAAIPYGTVQPWWKAVFQCLVFALAVCHLVGRLLKTDRTRHEYQIFLPVLALLAFAFVQTIAWSNSSIAGTNIGVTSSADVFQTRRFIIHLFALLLVGWLLVSHTTSKKRLQLLVELVIVIGVVSAIFGLSRQASQRGPGFVLPGLLPGYGYAQFINSNHFAFLMEMAVGLALGIAVSRGVTGRRFAAYVIAAIPMWIALVLANSRGGILSILCQVLFLALLLGIDWESRRGGVRPRTSELTLLNFSRRLAVRFVLAVALLGGAIATVIVVGGDPLAGRLESVSAELNRKTSDSYILRQNIWRATWELIKDHPISGVGFGGYWIAITKYHRASGEATPQEAHNDYLELLASGGLIGLSIGVWFIVALVATARSRLRTRDNYVRAVTLGALAGILTVGVHSLVDFGLHNTINALIFTVLVAIISLNTGDEAGKPIPQHG
jgi:O-antigen ligase